MNRPFTGALLDVAAVAALLGCSEKTVSARVSRHLLPFRRLGSRIVFRRDELEHFLDALPGVTLDEAQANVAMRSGEMVRR